MERRDFFKRLGFAGAAAVVTPQILAEIQPESEPKPGRDLVIQTPDGRVIPCKAFSLDAPLRGGIYRGSDCVFELYEWSLNFERNLIDKSRDPRFSTEEDPVPPWKEYTRGPLSVNINGSGRIIYHSIPWKIDNLVRIVLFNPLEDSVYDAEGLITALSYGEPDEISALQFQVLGEITETYK